MSGLEKRLAALEERVEKLARNTVNARSVTDIMLASRQAGYAEGLAVHDDHLAAAHAQQARTAFRVIPGGKSARAGGDAA